MSESGGVVTPPPLALWAQGARRLLGSTQSWRGTHLIEMCSPRGAHLPHGLRGDIRKHDVTGRSGGTYWGHGACSHTSCAPCPCV